MSSLNATIYHILIKSGDEIIFESSKLNTTYYYQKVTNRKQVYYIEVKANADSDEKAIVSIGEIIGGDAFGTKYRSEVEHPSKGEELKVSGTMAFDE